MQKISQEQWQALINQWQDSELSAAAFCQQHKIAYYNFLYWRRKLIQSNTNKLVPVVQSAPSLTADDIELVLPHGLVIRGVHKGNLSIAVELLRQL